MILLTEEEKVVLRDVLDMNLEEFEDAMHQEDGAGEPDWDALLRLRAGHQETIDVLQRIREKVNDDNASGGRSSPETV